VHVASSSKRVLMACSSGWWPYLLIPGIHSYMYSLIECACFIKLASAHFQEVHVRVHACVTLCLWCYGLQLKKYVHMHIYMYMYMYIVVAERGQAGLIHASGETFALA